MISEEISKISETVSLVSPEPEVDLEFRGKPKQDGLKGISAIDSEPQQYK